MKRTTVALSSMIALLAGCAGHQDAETLATGLSSVLTEQAKLASQYRNGLVDYTNETAKLAAENIAIGQRLQLQTDVLVGNLDLTGKGAGSDVFRKHSAVRPTAIAVSPVLSATEPALLPPSKTVDFTAAVMALHPVADGESGWETALFFVDIAADAYKQAQKQNLKKPAQ